MEGASMLKAVLFDLDETLIDQRSAADAAATEWACRHCGEGEGAVDKWRALSEKHYAAFQRRELTFQEQRRRRVQDFLQVKAGNDELDQLFEEYLELYESGWRAFEDAGPALDAALNLGLIVGVLTNGDAGHQRLKLEKCGLSSKVDVFIASSLLSAAKPAPEAFLEAVAIIGALAEESLMIGDSLSQDVQGALRSRLRAIWLNRQRSSVPAGICAVASLGEIRWELLADARQCQR
ncbi:putative hydrolase of the HAD superfamily [Friedmanniella endophytica]|uniref:Putative hydrolase of the HAD superfamily n=1 Tax=Microlunatus kandeliicorticis TaxID=1759536 RepID=A0A7W3P5K0_9ACTN|nr:HAD family hydrolase [Microlunatus kandeliicorticis]MBA8794056.1 putative hydrolase of the HAD superfamily [Microlunatus kandeliicorticis]